MSLSSIVNVPNADDTRPILTKAEIDERAPTEEVRHVELARFFIARERWGAMLSSFVRGIGNRSANYPRRTTGLRLIARNVHRRGGHDRGQRTIVQVRVKQAGDVLELRPEQLRTLVAREEGLSEIILRAFILRRLMLVNRQLGNVVVIGSRHSADTLRLREFLGRNGYPYTYVDLDSDETSRGLLERFSIAVSEIPIVIGNGTKVLRNPSTSQVADCLG